MLLKKRGRQAFSLIEVLVAFLILLIAVLVMVGYAVTVHRSAKDGKRQALASMEARSMIETIRDYPVAFAQALTPEGLSETRSEYLLDTEADVSKNEQGQMSGAQFRMLGKVEPIAGEIHRVVVTVDWDEDGRHRQISIESRAIAPDR